MLVKMSVESGDLESTVSTQKVIERDPGTINLFNIKPTVMTSSVNILLATAC